MVWGDGSCFEGNWKNDLRSNGTMNMAQTNWIYKGIFVDDKYHDKNGIIMLPNLIIYQGPFTQGKTSAIGLLLYPNGSIYYGQHSQFIKNGIGKIIEINGSFQEGQWESDKLSGTSCRIYDNTTNECYSGVVSDGQRNG